MNKRRLIKPYAAYTCDLARDTTSSGGYLILVVGPPNSIHARRTSESTTAAFAFATASPTDRQLKQKIKRKHPRENSIR